MPRPRKNSARINLIISVAVHALVVCLLFFFAAREGAFGNKLQEITAVIVPKEKPVEQPKPPEPKVEPPKDETPKPQEQPQVAQQEAPKSEPTAVASVAPAVAPPSIGGDSFFSDGAKLVETSTNSAVVFYKNYVEYTLRSQWNRPEGIEDDTFVAEFDVSIDSSGKVKKYTWKKNSGNKLWDDSVLQAMQATKTISRQPPTNFPSSFIVRFDVLPASEPVVQ